MGRLAQRREAEVECAPVGVTLPGGDQAGLTQLREFQSDQAPTAFVDFRQFGLAPYPAGRYEAEDPRAAWSERMFGSDRMHPRPPLPARRRQRVIERIDVLP